MESDAAATERLKVPLLDSCHPKGVRPNIIMIHDESSFDIREAEGVKVPQGYGSHFKSFDGKERTFLAESNGGPSWFTEYNVLAGLSSRSFGRFAYFVTRIASGRVERGLPLALRHQVQGLVVEETVGFDVLGAEIVRVIEVLDTGRGLETARAHERAERRIQRDRVVAAAAQRQRQSALDAARGNAGHEIGEPAERARR